MKFAYLVQCELRALRKTINNLYKYIIEPFDADIIICVQNFCKDDEELLKLFHKNVKFLFNYDKPNSNKYIGEKNIFNHIKTFNCNYESAKQMWINHHIFADIITHFFIDNYDYYIICRTDIEILFPFPEKSLFEQIPASIYFFDTKYNRHWGGFGTIAAFIHKDYIIDLLKSTYDLITDENKLMYFINNYNKIEYINKTARHERYLEYYTNCEYFQLYAMGLKNLKINYINNVNCFITYETLNDYYTWSKPLIHPTRNVFSKYHDLTDEAFENLRLWNIGYRWKYDDMQNIVYLTN